jgi:hypothetical protein
MKFQKLNHSRIVTVIIIAISVLSCIEEEPFEKTKSEPNKLDLKTILYAQVDESEFQETYVDAMESEIDVVLDNLEMNNFTGNVEIDKLGSCVNIHVDSLNANGWPKILTLTFDCLDSIDNISIKRYGSVLVLVEKSDDLNKIYTRYVYNNQKYYGSGDISTMPYNIYTDSTIGYNPISFNGTRIFTRLSTKMTYYNNGQNCRYEIIDTINFKGKVTNFTDYPRSTYQLRKAILHYAKEGSHWESMITEDTIYFTGAIASMYYFDKTKRNALTPIMYTFNHEWPYNRVISSGSVELSGTIEGAGTIGILGQISYSSDKGITNVYFSNNDTTFTLQRTMNKGIRGCSANSGCQTFDWWE